MHYIKARTTLLRFETGDIVDFLFIAGEAAEQASSSLGKDGHEILAVEPAESAVRVRVRKA